ncbi:hypothetical protein ACW14X_28335 [Nocardioides sp. YJ-D4]
MTEFHDPLVTPDEAEGLPERFFDRFVFNLHPTEATAPSIILGFGIYPAKNVVDGFIQLSNGTEQRNLRFSDELSATDWRTGGPFRWDVQEPNREWRLTLAPNPTGIEFDLRWTARTPAWQGSVAVTNTAGDPTSFDHLFQSGTYSGWLIIDGVDQQVDGWYGQRDRSRGVRTMSGGQGLHIWYQAQFPDRSIGFLLVEGRDGSRLLLEGAVMHTDGGLDDIVEVTHDLVFDDSLDLEAGWVRVVTESGATYDVATDAGASGGYMAGAGYGGHHGKPMGRDHQEYDVYALDGSVTPKTLDSSLTDRLASFDWNGIPGVGIFEFALTRSSSYRYVPTLRSAGSRKP